MEIKEMDNDTLIRYYIAVDREIKTKMSEKKQLEQEMNNRFDDGKLGS